MYQKAFDLDEHKAIVASSGDDGLQKAKTERPDIILLDIMMPKKNGLEALRELKAHPDTTAIPVIMLTNLDKIKDVEAALSMGAMKYPVKAEHTPKEIVQQEGYRWRNRSWRPRSYTALIRVPAGVER